MQCLQISVWIAEVTGSAAELVCTVLCKVKPMHSLCSMGMSRPQLMEATNQTYCRTTWVDIIYICYPPPRPTFFLCGMCGYHIYMIRYTYIYIYIYYNDITYNYIFNTQLNSCSFYPDWFSWVLATVCLLFLEKELCSNTRAWMQQCRVRMYSTRALTETLGMA